MREKNSLVGTLLNLTVVGGLLDKVQKLLAQSLIGDGPGDTGFLSHCVEFVDVDGVENEMFQKPNLLRNGSRKGSLPCKHRESKLVEWCKSGKCSLVKPKKSMC